MKTIKKFWWAIVPLLGLLGALLKGRPPWKGRAEKSMQEASEARHGVVDAKADAKKEANAHEAEKEHAELADMSDDDLFADALERERAKRSGD